MRKLTGFVYRGIQQPTNKVMMDHKGYNSLKICIFCGSWGAPKAVLLPLTYPTLHRLLLLAALPIFFIFVAL